MRKSRFSYQWVIVGCCFLMIFTALGFGSSPRKLYMVAVPKALGLDYGPYSLSETFRYASSSIINLFFGALVIKFGVRRMIGTGFVLLAAAMLVFSAAESLPVIYLGGLLLGAGLTMTSTTMSSYVVNLWCKEHKGTITGLVLCANGLGGATAMQILSPIINESLFSYRSAYRLTALIMLAVGALVFLLIRNAPSSEASLSTSGKKQPKKPVHEGITLQQALRKPYFYVAAVCIFLTGMVLQGIVGSDANHMTHVGLDQASVAAALSIHSLALSGCKFLTGALYDRKGLKITMLICDCAALLTLLMLIFINDSSMGLTMAYGYSVMSAVALPLETIMLPLITAELFGQRSYAQMLGIISAINTIGFSFGPPFTNFVFDALGTYVPVFWAYALVMALVTAAFMYALSAAAKDREKASLAGGI